MENYYIAKEGYVYVNHTSRLYGEHIISTDDYIHNIDDFELVKKEHLQSILDEWKLGGK
jgi:hypothetical protein